MDPFDAAAEYVLGLPEGELPLITFVGSACRTHYVDINRLRFLIADLYELRPFEAVHGGMFPFDAYVEKACKEAGVQYYLIGPTEKAKRLTPAYSRDPDMAQGTAMLVAFPKEEAVGGLGSKKARIFPPESADLDVVRGAVQHGVPILAIYRNGHAIWQETT